MHSSTDRLRISAAMTTSARTKNLSFENLEDRTFLTGDMSFAEPVRLSDAGAPARIIAADLDNDGDFDLIASNYRAWHSAEFGDSGLVLLGNGDGTFAKATTYGASGDNLAASDFDGDGNLDLAVASGRIPGDPPMPFVRILLGKGDGTFEEADTYKDVGGEGVTVVDLNGDGNLDLIVANQNSSQVQALLGNGNGRFIKGNSYPVGDGPIALTAGDWDGDGDLDLVTANHKSNDLSVLLGNGDGTFGDAKEYMARDVSHYSAASSILTAADLDSDGDFDLVVANSGYVRDGISVLLGDGDGTFTDAVSYSIILDTDLKDPWPGGVHANDLDNDGDLDLTVNDAHNDVVKLLVNRGDGTFDLHRETFDAGPAPLGHTLADLDGDGDLDLAVTNDAGCPLCRPGVSLLFNSSEPPRLHELGDANMDGTFNQLDIVQVLQAAKYLTGKPATFAEGDWNSDGLFNQLDLIEALATVNYTRGQNHE